MKTASMAVFIVLMILVSGCTQATGLRPIRTSEPPLISIVPYPAEDLKSHLYFCDDERLNDGQIHTPNPQLGRVQHSPFKTIRCYFQGIYVPDGLHNATVRSFYKAGVCYGELARALHLYNGEVVYDCITRAECTRDKMLEPNVKLPRLNYVDFSHYPKFHETPQMNLENHQNRIFLINRDRNYAILCGNCSQGSNIMIFFYFDTFPVDTRQRLTILNTC